MADVHIPELLKAKFIENSRNLRIILQQLKRAKQEQENLFSDKHNSAANVNTEISERLADIDGIRGAVAINLNKINTDQMVYNRTLKVVGGVLALSHFIIDVDDGAGGATITAGHVGGNVTLQSWDTTFVAGDLLELRNAANPDSNGQVTINTVTSNVITLTENMGGEDELKDISLIIELIERT